MLLSSFYFLKLLFYVSRDVCACPGVPVKVTGSLCEADYFHLYVCS